MFRFDFNKLIRDKPPARMREEVKYILWLVYPAIKLLLNLVNQTNITIR